LARSIYTRFKAPGRAWLIPSDFYPAFNDEVAAKEAFKVFDTDNNGDVSRGEIKTALLKIYKERRLLSRSMRDVSQALRTLDRILMFFAAVVVFFISLSVFGLRLDASLSSIYSLGIAASFIFKNSASNAFDAIMFLFVMQ
jgi:small-conductance mechanosensitive channel